MRGWATGAGIFCSDFCSSASAPNFPNPSFLVLPIKTAMGLQKMRMKATTEQNDQKPVQKIDELAMVLARASQSAVVMDVAQGRAEDVWLHAVLHDAHGPALRHLDYVVVRSGLAARWAVNRGQDKSHGRLRIGRQPETQRSGPGMRLPHGT
jgi:hypothetical protein